MHVMMAVEPIRGSLIEPTELVYLGRYDIIERAHESRVKYYASKAMTAKISANLALTVRKLRGAVRR